MHELSITQNIVAIVHEAAAGRRVLRVNLDVGRLSGIVTDAILFCFDLVAKGTALEGATLAVNQIDGRARCRGCAAELAVEDLFATCACGSRDLELVAGKELLVKSMELEGDG